MLDAWLPSQRNHYSCTRNKWCPGSRRTTSGGWTHGHVLWNKKEVVCVQIMLKTSTWLWFLPRTLHPGPVIAGDSLSPLPLTAYIHSTRGACSPYELTSPLYPDLRQKTLPSQMLSLIIWWSLLSIGGYEILQSRNNSNNNNSDIVSI